MKSPQEPVDVEEDARVTASSNNSNQEEPDSESVFTYKDIPPLDPIISTIPVKTFVIEQRWRESAIVNAVIDGRTIRGGYMYMDIRDPDSKDMAIRANAIAATADAMLSPFQGWVAKMGYEPFHVGLVDIVTYPVWFSLVYDIKLENPQVLARINHNLIAPYVSVLSPLCNVLTISHINEEPIDDAPTHNLIGYSLPAVMALCQQSSKCKMTDKESLAWALDFINQDIMKLIKVAPNQIGVSGNTPVMDDRYVYMERRAEDGQKRVLQPYTFSILPGM